MKKIIFILIVLSSAVNLTAEDDHSFRKREIQFIKELYQSGRYFDCISETAKLSLSENKSRIEYFKYTNYYLAGQYSTVLSNYTVDTSSDEMKFSSLLLISGSYFSKGMYYESYGMLRNFEYSEFPDKYRFTMFLRRVEPLILSGDMEKIDKEIGEAGILLEDEYNFTKLREELQQYREDGLKSPGYAALMSAVVPGLGQCYSGYPGEGLISFLSVVATAAGGFYLKDAGHKSSAYTCFFFSGLFYGGNIYGAYNSAGAANNKVLLNRHRSVVSQYGSYNPGDYIDIESVFN
jgi:TM2 domain-containing membrane protein YozV